MCSVVVFPFVMVCVGTHPVCVPSVAAACGSAKIYRPFFVYVHVHMHMHMSHVITCTTTQLVVSVYLI